MVVLSAKGAEAERVAVEDVGHGRRLFLVPCAAERGAWTQPVQHRHPIAAAPSYIQARLVRSHILRLT
jgi:hypothetical protein